MTELINLQAENSSNFEITISNFHYSSSHEEIKSLILQEFGKEIPFEMKNNSKNKFSGKIKIKEVSKEIALKLISLHRFPFKDRILKVTLKGVKIVNKLTEEHLTQAKDNDFDDFDIEDEIEDPDLENKAKVLFVF